MRASVTLVEAFRRYIQEPCFCQGSCMCEAEIVASIKRELEPNARMQRGSILHKAIETMRATGVDGVQLFEALKACDGGRVAEALASGRAVHEGKFTKAYGDVLVVGKYDLLALPVAYDWKGREDAQMADYSKSMQWRLTLDALPDVDFFRYEAFQIWHLEPKKPTKKKPVPDPVSPLLQLQYLPPGQEFTRYAGLHEDCAEWVDGLVAFAKRRGLESHLEDRQSNEAPF